MPGEPRKIRETWGGVRERPRADDKQSIETAGPRITRCGKQWVAQGAAACSRIPASHQADIRDRHHPRLQLTGLPKCTKACLEATGAICDCSCLGAYHGEASDGWFERIGDVMVTELGEITRWRMWVQPV
jgi:hypothetical protein